MATASGRARDAELSAPPAALLVDTTSVSWESGLVEPVQPAPTAGRRGGPAASWDDLLRRRVTAAATIMAAIYGLLFAWCLATPATRVGTVLLGLRAGVAAIVAALLYGRPALGRRQVKAIEYLLFGGMTVMGVLAQYLVSVELAGRGRGWEPNVLANEKNGVLQIFALMIAYAAFIPNDARDSARVVIAMALASLLASASLLTRPEAGGVVYALRNVEHVASNALYVLIGAGLAIYGAGTLQGLRAQLREARRFGQYQLIQPLGAGGMGEVYLAEHRLLKRPCALKLIRGEGAADPVALARFEREVQAAARLTHPNTIEIYDYGHTEDGTFYYVMEYLRGLTLGDLVKRFGPVPPGRAVYLLRQACRGLAEAHSLGLVHRDLKPANILIASRGGEHDVVKIVDFGLVKLTQDAAAPDLTIDRTVSGTPMFMSPEQATGSRDLDGRSDLYALGALAYYALTGHAPFEGQTAMAVMIGHARDPVVPPSRLRPEIPADLEAVVLRCLAKRPEQRYPNVRALAKALGECGCAAEWGDNRAAAWWTATFEMDPIGQPHLSA